MPESIHIGTSGWSYDDWVGPFYPAGVRKSDYLEHYSRAFQVVEVDSTYYRPPSVGQVRAWADRTPAGFKFALKAPGLITREKALLDCEAEMQGLVDALAPLGSKLICVLLQFSYFNRSAFASVRPFLERLSAFLARFAGAVPLAVEIRNKNWLTRDYFELLRSHAAAAALVEHAWLPPLNQVAANLDVVTAPFSYVRLIGDREEIERVTTTWEKPVIDREADLARVASAIRTIAARVPVYTFVNNHYAGHGPDTCRRLRERLDAASDASA